MWIQIRDVVGTDQRVGTDQGPGIDLSSTCLQILHLLCTSSINYQVIAALSTCHEAKENTRLIN